MDNHIHRDDCDCIVFVCMPVRYGPAGVGSDIQHCYECGTDVWSSIGQRAVAAAEYPTARIDFRCIKCMSNSKDKVDVDLQKSVAWARKGGDL